jgi:hypothetical protein
MPNKFVKFTTPNDQPVWIVAQWVTKVRTVSPGEMAVGAETLITMGGTDQAVKEKPEDVVRAIEVAGI